MLRGEEDMGIATTREAIIRPIIATVIALVVLLVLVSIIQPSGLGVLTVFLWVDIVGVIAVGGYLIARAQRPMAGAGAILCAVAISLAFFWLSWIVFSIWIDFSSRGGASTLMRCWRAFASSPQF